MKKMNKALGVAFALAMVTGAAQAGFNVEAPQQRLVDSAVPAKGGLVNIGAPKVRQPVVKGFANEVSLITALKQVVPEGWHAKRSGGLDVSQLVSWKGEQKPWAEVLENLAVDYGFSATLDWDKKELTVAPSTIKTSNILALKNAVGRNVIEAVKPVTEVAAGPSVKSWVLSDELTLRQNIEAWAKKENYKVSWAAVNYPINQPVTLTGDLDAENGPLFQLVEAYRLAEQPITITFWSNRVIRVENASFKQLPLTDEVPNRRAMK